MTEDAQSLSSESTAYSSGPRPSLLCVLKPDQVCLRVGGFWPTSPSQRAGAIGKNDCEKRARHRTLHKSKYFRVFESLGFQQSPNTHGGTFSLREI